MPFPPSTDSLTGLPFAEALRRLREAGLGDPRVVESVPPRPRQPFPGRETWRVARVLAIDGVIELVIVPPIPLPTGEAIPAGVPAPTD